MNPEIRYLTVYDVMAIYDRVMELSGGAVGIRDIGALESAIAQPRMTFSGNDLYPTIVEKAAVLGFSIIRNHPFIDGNKRIGHAAMEVFLILNGFEIQADVDEQERLILLVAAGETDLADLTSWLHQHIIPIPKGSSAD